MMAIIWSCCTAISAGNMADGSSVAEESHMAVSSTGILRTEVDTVKKTNKAWSKTAEQFGEQKGVAILYMWVCDGYKMKKVGERQWKKIERIKKGQKKTKYSKRGRTQTQTPRDVSFPVPVGV